MNESTANPAAGLPRDAVRLVDIINLSSSAETLLKNRVRSMRALGIDNRIICMDGPYVGPLRESGVPVETASMPRGLNPLRMLLSTFEMAAYMRRERIDLVHTHCSMPGILGRVAAKLAGVPVIVHTVHGYHVHDRWNPVMRNIYTLAEKFCGRFTDMMLTQNRTDFEFVRRQRIVPADRLRLIGNGIDLGRFRPAARVPSSAPLTLMCTARLEPVKNHGQLLEAVKLLKDRGVDVRVWLIGDGDLRLEYERQCAALGIEDRVLFLGYRDDIPALLLRADVAVLTSVKEGIPRALLEGMAMGLPAIGTRVVGTDETVRDGETGYLVELGDSRGLADRIAELAADPELRARLGAQGRRLVESEFDEHSIVESLAAVYRQLLRTKGIAARAAMPQPVKS
ncbi:MAG: hypothetical protein DMD82_00265 [Candidatus Rokuibacteriota bacterium]|nr:MAG: hypothetical protein DMD82_00265 [Candidatus Rokubacteria bacterium]